MPAGILSAISQDIYKLTPDQVDQEIKLANQGQPSGMMSFAQLLALKKYYDQIRHPSPQQPTSTVAQDLQQQLQQPPQPQQPPQGVAGLPTDPHMFQAQHYEGGGIVHFDQGGKMPEDYSGLTLGDWRAHQRSTPYTMPMGPPDDMPPGGYAEWLAQQPRTPYTMAMPPQDNSPAPPQQPYINQPSVHGTTGAAPSPLAGRRIPNKSSNSGLKELWQKYNTMFNFDFGKPDLPMEHSAIDPTSGLDTGVPNAPDPSQIPRMGEQMGPPAPPTSHLMGAPQEVLRMIASVKDPQQKQEMLVAYAQQLGTTPESLQTMMSGGAGDMGGGPGSMSASYKTLGPGAGMPTVGAAPAYPKPLDFSAMLDQNTKAGQDLMDQMDKEREPYVKDVEKPLDQRLQERSKLEEQAGITGETEDELRQHLVQLRGDMPARKEDAKWMALAKAGFAMAAAKSPYALSNIGEGAKEGLDDYSKAIRDIRTDDLEREKIIANIDHLRRQEKLGRVANVETDMRHAQDNLEKIDARRTQMAAHIFQTRGALAVGQMTALAHQYGSDATTASAYNTAAMHANVYATIARAQIAAENNSTKMLAAVYADVEKSPFWAARPPEEKKAFIGEVMRQFSAVTGKPWTAEEEAAFGPAKAATAADYEAAFKSKSK